MDTKPYRVCTTCIMDTSDPDITFDHDGVCNHCHRYRALRGALDHSGDDRALTELVARIKAKGRGRAYDCVLGISGGVDSTYVAYMTKRLGLRALVAHLDNGWDDPRATQNVKSAMAMLGFDMHDHVIDPEEFKDFQLAYLRASVVDIEAVTDHAISALLFDVASRNGIKYILTGTNVATEGIIVSSWVCDKNDLSNLLDIHRKFGHKPIKTLPTMGMRKILYYMGIKGIQLVRLLNYIPYIKEEAKQTLINELAWTDYGSKHHESVWTRFYQTYILPKKFGIDKRRAHLSSLIFSGQATRQQALEEIAKPPCDQAIIDDDRRQVLEKLSLSEQEFEAIMAAPVRSHHEFKTNRTWLILRSIHRWLRERKGSRT